MKKYWLLFALAFQAHTSHAHRAAWGNCRPNMPAFWSIRGGEASTEEDLDKKVQAAMRKLGLSVPSADETADSPVSGKKSMLSSASTEQSKAPTTLVKEEGVHAMVDRIAKDMKVDKNLVMAAVGATAHNALEDEPKYDENAARAMIQQELDMIGQVSEEAAEVKQLVGEGYSSFLSRRALAFADMDINNARAILIADQEDEEEEAASAPPTSPQPVEKTRVEIPAADFPQTFVEPKVTVPAPQPKPAMTPPAPAKKADVVFDAKSSEIHELVVESPVPLLLYVYADWCGPCKTLSPALEEMAVKAGGAFRLVKVNTDNERPISAALEVKALPTVFAVSKGKILNSFQGMPNSQDFMKNFMMGLLMPGAPFDPPVSKEDKENYANLSSKLVKAAGTASFSFSQRERLQVRTSDSLDALVDAGDMVDAGESAKVLRSLMSNIIRDPYETKFRKVNLQNKVIAAKVAAFPQCIAILKSVGFVQDGPNTLVMGKSKAVVNVAPLIVVRDYIDKWIDKNRSAIAKAERKRRDEIERSRLAAAKPAEEVEEEKEGEEDESAKNICRLKLRVEGKNKVIESSIDGDEPLSAILALLPISQEEGEEIQLTCIAKRLVVKSTDDSSMQKSLREHGLLPAAFIVAKVVGDKEEAATSSASMLAERAAAKKNRKKGSHTMQSIGIYAKDDKNKGELIDGGGGTLFEHDVTDDESEVNGEEEDAEDGDETVSEEDSTSADSDS